MASDGPIIIAQPHTDPQPPIDELAIPDPEPVEPLDKIAVPNRIDAGLAADESDGGLELAWLLAGGALVTASGAAVALRARKRHAA